MNEPLSNVSELEQLLADTGTTYAREKLRVKTGKKYVDIPTSYLFKKLLEEVGELIEALTARHSADTNALIDEEFGDVLITLTVLAATYDRSPMRCALHKVDVLKERLKKLKKKKGA